MSTPERTKWWAIVGRDSGYTLDVKPEERARYLRAFREEGAKIVGEFGTAAEAGEYLKTYLSESVRR